MKSARQVAFLCTAVAALAIDCLAFVPNHNHNAFQLSSQRQRQQFTTLAISPDSNDEELQRLEERSQPAAVFKADTQRQLASFMLGAALSLTVLTGGSSMSTAAVDSRFTPATPVLSQSTPSLTTKSSAAPAAANKKTAAFEASEKKSLDAAKAVLATATQKLNAVKQEVTTYSQADAKAQIALDKADKAAKKAKEDFILQNDKLAQTKMSTKNEKTIAAQAKKVADAKILQQQTAATLEAAQKARKETALKLSSAQIQQKQAEKSKQTATQSLQQAEKKYQEFVQKVAAQEKKASEQKKKEDEAARKREMKLKQKQAEEAKKLAQKQKEAEIAAKKKAAEAAKEALKKKQAKIEDLRKKIAKYEDEKRGLQKQKGSTKAIFKIDTKLDELKQQLQMLKNSK